MKFPACKNFGLACMTILMSLCYLRIAAQQPDDPWLKELLRYHASPLLEKVLSMPDSFHYQFIYTRIDRDANNQPHFTNYYLHTDSTQYFNPASMVKLPVACMAMEKLRDLHIKGLDLNTPMLTDSAMPGQSHVYTDSTAANGLPSVGQYVKRIFLISDNNAYNRLYEWVGQQYMNERLWSMGYTSSRITRRFEPMTEEQNRYTNPIRFVENGQLIYRQPLAYNALAFDFSKPVHFGWGHFDGQDSLVASPMDFTTHNNMPLLHLQQIMQSVLFPASVPAWKRFKLSDTDYRFLYRYMSEFPSESRHPAYDSSEYFNSYTKFFMFRADSSAIPDYIRVFNKTGWSYGFLTDVAYIVDFKHKVEFMLSGTVYVNSDGVLNDNKYEYEETGYPFFKELGNIMYQYELKRDRMYTPDLSRFEIDYKK